MEGEVREILKSDVQMKFKGGRKKSHLAGETGNKFMAEELSLYSEYRIVVNAGRRTVQGREQREQCHGGGKEECRDAQKGGSRLV